MDPFRSESLDAAWAICRVLWHSDTGAVDLASRLAPWAVLLLIGAEHAWRDALLEKARGLWRSHPVVYTILLVESLLLALQLSPAGIPSFILLQLLI